MEKNTCAGQINPFLGANAPGNFFSGPYLPYAVARLGADTIYPQNAGGYQRGRPVKCISHLHVGGTGGAGRYGNIGVTAYPGPATVRPPYMELTGEQAQAGYYSACTRAGVRLELTSTQHTGVHRFSFPQGQEANVFIDAAAVIQTEGAFPGEHAPGAGHIAVDATGACIGGYVEQVSACEFCGRGDFIGGWGHRVPYSVCFFARFDRPARSVLLANSRGVYRSACAAGEGSCINASFGAGELELRVGVSFVSVANARAYVDDEAAQSFDALRQKAFDIWEQSVSCIRVTGGRGEERALFYSLFARLLAGPADLGVDQEFPLWKSGVRHFTDYYCLWDSVRNANSLLSLFDPEREAELLNCLLDVAEKTGWLPDAWIAGHSAMIQGGSSADILFCEAKEKGICGIDYEKALRYMRKNNEQPSPARGFTAAIPAIIIRTAISQAIMCRQAAFRAIWNTRIRTGASAALRSFWAKRTSRRGIGRKREKSEISGATTSNALRRGRSAAAGRRLTRRRFLIRTIRSTRIITRRPAGAGRFTPGRISPSLCAVSAEQRLLSARLTHFLIRISTIPRK